MTSLRIAIIIDDFFPASGGIGRSVQTQIEELSALGHEVTLIAPDRHLEKPRNARVIECPTMYLEGLPAHLSVLHFSEKRARLISDVATFDVVHTQTERGALLLGARIAALQGISHLHTFHANIAGTHRAIRGAVFGTWSYQALIVPLLKRIVAGRFPASRRPSRRSESGGHYARTDWLCFADIAKRVDAYTVPSPFMRELIDEAAGAELPSYVVPTGYNRDLLAAIGRATRDRTDDKVRFLSIGRLAKEKRLDVLVRAFREADRADAELVIVGDGDQRDLLKGLARGAGNIDFRGHLSHLDAIAYELVNADALVLSSYRFDSQALVITEAVAAGLPVLYCDDRLTVGVSEESALLSRPGSHALAAGIRRLMDRDLRSSMAAATTGILADIAPERTAERYLNAYTELIEKKKESRG